MGVVEAKVHSREVMVPVIFYDGLNPTQQRNKTHLPLKIHMFTL
jgi:hypothetical protein